MFLWIAVMECKLTSHRFQRKSAQMRKHSLVGMSQHSRIVKVAWILRSKNMDFKMNKFKWILIKSTQHRRFRWNTNKMSQLSVFLNPLCLSRDTQKSFYFNQVQQKKLFKKKVVPRWNRRIFRISYKWKRTILLIWMKVLLLCQTNSNNSNDLLNWVYL